VNPIIVPFHQTLLSVGCFMSSLEAIILPVCRRTEPKEKAVAPWRIARLGSLRLPHEHEVRPSPLSRWKEDRERLAIRTRDSSLDAASEACYTNSTAPGIFSREFFAPDDLHPGLHARCKSVAAGVNADVCFWDLKIRPEAAGSWQRQGITHLLLT